MSKNTNYLKIKTLEDVCNFHQIPYLPIVSLSGTLTFESSQLAAALRLRYIIKALNADTESNVLYYPLLSINKGLTKAGEINSDITLYYREQTSLYTSPIDFYQKLTGCKTSAILYHLMTHFYKDVYELVYGI